MPPFALVAHSMGGLDARHLIARLDPDRRVKSLVTVGTPHLGTPLASWLLDSRRLVPAVIRRIGNPGLRELTPEVRAAFRPSGPLDAGCGRSRRGGAGQRRLKGEAWSGAGPIWNAGSPGVWAGATG